MTTVNLGPYNATVDNVTKNVAIGGLPLAGTIPANAANVTVTASIVGNYSYSQIISGWVPVGGNSSWITFLNTYGIWYQSITTTGTHNFAVDLEFPVSGTYTITTAVDNFGTWILNGTTYTLGDYTFQNGAVTVQAYIPAGIHNYSANMTNSGKSGGFATQILYPNGTELWNTRLSIPPSTPPSSGGGTVIVAGGGSSLGLAAF